MHFLGVDPGASGGIGVVDYDGKDVYAESFVKRTIHDVGELFDFVSDEFSVARACIENVHSMPKQGVKSSFNFGRSFGALEAFLVSLGISYELVSPAVWQREIGCLTRGDKNVTKAKAQALFPRLRITHAIADAMLIAEYARRRFRGLSGM